MTDTEGMKQWARDNLPKDSRLRKNILRTKEKLTVEEAVIKCQVWMELYSGEINERGGENH